uniref:Uncharacterized protein n=1 Tax=Rhizophora mucronata TaxID=61149 RepID=A0A2P2NAL9_RHIMU
MIRILWCRRTIYGVCSALYRFQGPLGMPTLRGQSSTKSLYCPSFNCLNLSTSQSLGQNQSYQSTGSNQKRREL